MHDPTLRLPALSDLDPRLAPMLAGLDRMRIAGLISAQEHELRQERLLAKFAPAPAATALAAPRAAVGSADAPAAAAAPSAVAVAPPQVVSVTRPADAPADGRGWSVRSARDRQRSPRPPADEVAAPPADEVAAPPADAPTPAPSVPSEPRPVFTWVPPPAPAPALSVPSALAPAVTASPVTTSPVTAPPAPPSGGPAPAATPRPVPPPASPPPIGTLPPGPGSPAFGPRGSSRRTMGMALAVMVGLVASATVGYLTLGRRPSPVSTAATALTEPATLQDFIPVAKEWVVAHRGLAFTRDVPVQFLADAAFDQKFLSGNPTQAIDRQAVADEEHTLKAMHLIDPGVDLVALEQQTGAGGVEGFYDVKAKALFVRGTAPTPYVREVLVHELTHALQDQAFGLDRALPPSRSGEAALSFVSLAEGDARRIEDEYRASLPAAEQQQAADASYGTPEQRALAARIPAVLVELGQFPYDAGERFTKALVDQGGQKLLDQAFTQPPGTTAQIIDPHRYISGGGSAQVPLPGVPVAPFSGGVWGAIGFTAVFDHLVATGALTPAAASAAARSWGGDVWLAWTQAGRYCWRDNLASSGPDTDAALKVGLRAYAGVAGVTITAGSLDAPGAIQITACTA